jgi:hypothetical protein
MKNAQRLICGMDGGMDGMMVANSHGGSQAYGGCVRDLDHRSMTIFSPRVITIRQDSMKKSRSICGS